MSRLLVNATVTVRLEDIPIHGDPEELTRQQIEDKIREILNKRLVLLDIKGGRTGDDGSVESCTIEEFET